MDPQDEKPRAGSLFLDERDRPPSSRLRDEVEDKAEHAATVLDELLALLDIDADVDIREDDERIVLDISGPEAKHAIGRKGQTIDALQFILNKIVNQDPDEERRYVVVDSGDFRARRDHGLEARAREEAKRALTEGKVVTLEPMNPRDRRVIHLSLAKLPGITTESSGHGARRRVQIIPTTKKR